MLAILRFLSMAGALAFSLGAANASVYDLTNGGNVGTGVSLAGGTAATWAADSNGAFSYTTDYTDFKLTADASTETVRFNVVPNGLALPPGFMFEVGTAPGDSSVFGPSNTTAIIPNFTMLANTEYYMSFTSTGGGSFTAAVAQPSAVPVPGALLLFGSALVGVGTLLRRRNPEEVVT